VIQTDSKKTFLDAEWINSTERKGELNLMVKRPDGSKIAEIRPERQKGIFQFDWNRTFTFVSGNDRFQLTNYKILKNIWKLELSNSTIYYEKGFIRYVYQESHLKIPIIKIDEDVIQVLEKTDLKKLELAITIHLVFDKPWIEVVF
jgi:hypothetical protein